MKRILILVLLWPVCLHLSNGMIKPIANEKYIVLREYKAFKTEFKKRESGNNWRVVNPRGYMGYYQFGKDALEYLGFDITVKQFKADSSLFSPQLQELLFDRWVDSIACALRGEIYYFSGSVIHGTKISKSGIIAAAHLAGITGVKRFFRYGYNPQDENNTSLLDYMEHFKNYNF